ncbi:hypothetical protein LSAT2_000135 [Lamellibrachia satsuma]|nr:hypothetical protein LSAT2_000135 [Lamellibrachia satsuma]
MVVINNDPGETLVSRCAFAGYPCLVTASFGVAAGVANRCHCVSANGVVPETMQGDFCHRVADLIETVTKSLLFMRSSCASGSSPGKYGDIKDGVFGKVLVDHVDSDGVVTPVFDFNLTKGNEQSSDCVSPASGREDMKTEEEWSLVAVKELAAMLRVSEDDKWSACARKLGFTDREIRVHLGRAKDPFAAMFAAFKARDGRPEEFVQTLYVVSRMANVDPTSDSDYSSGWSSFSGTSSGVAQSVFGEELEEGYHDGEEDGACDAATIIVNDLHDLIPATSSLCLTPPPTPRKKRSNASEDELAPQKKKCRLLQFDEPSSVQTPAASSSVVDVSCDATRDEDVAIQDGCQGEISNSIVWQVSAQMDGRWKSLGRALDLPETELMCIEQASRGDRRQCAYQTILRWRQVHPQRYTCGDLYRALCDCSSVEVARMCCGGNDAKKTPCWHSDS